jgi:3-oxoacyl-[acyl-carrier protein] reductase
VTSDTALMIDDLVAPNPPMTAPMNAIPEIKQQQLDHIPMGRFGTPDEIAAAIAFLCTENASYITGSALIVDGGCSVI